MKELIIAIELRYIYLNSIAIIIIINIIHIKNIFILLIFR